MGDYDLVVTKQNAGRATVSSDTIDDFSYEILVTNVSPNSGSLGGGTDITVTGTNFKKDDTQVFIGTGVNMICVIKSITSVSIVCTTPASSGEAMYDSPVEVVVVERLTEESVTLCGGGNTCTF